MLQGQHEGEVHELRRDQRDDGDLYRGADVLPRVEARASTLTRIRPVRPMLYADQCITGVHHVRGLERAIVKQRRNRWNRKYCQRQGGGKGQHEGKPQAPVEQR